MDNWSDLWGEIYGGRILDYADPGWPLHNRMWLSKFSVAGGIFITGGLPQGWLVWNWVWFGLTEVHRTHRDSHTCASTSCRFSFLTKVCWRINFRISSRRFLQRRFWTLHLQQSWKSFIFRFSNQNNVCATKRQRCADPFYYLFDTDSASFMKLYRSWARQTSSIAS